MQKADWTAKSRLSQLTCTLFAAGAMLMAFSQTTAQAAVWAGLSCALAIFARIWQAEAHYEGK